jgi:hypothetical protein
MDSGFVPRRNDEWSWLVVRVSSSETRDAAARRPGHYFAHPGRGSGLLAALNASHGSRASVKTTS